MADLHIHSAFSDRSAQAGSEKILIVDDEKDLVDLVTYNLKGKGYQTLRAYKALKPGKRFNPKGPK